MAYFVSNGNARGLFSDCRREMKSDDQRRSHDSTHHHTHHHTSNPALSNNETGPKELNYSNQSPTLAPCGKRCFNAIVLTSNLIPRNPSVLLRIAANVHGRPNIPLTSPSMHCRTSVTVSSGEVMDADLTIVLEELAEDYRLRRYNDIGRSSSLLFSQWSCQESCVQ